MQQLTEGARAVLRTADADAKAAASRDLATAWRAGSIGEVGAAGAPDRPARPVTPALRPPREVPRRKITAAPVGRFALLHALAHIELNAIDLAWDMVARFAEATTLPRAFFDDWVAVANDEAKHFQMLQSRLGDLGGGYGDLAAHDGLWQAAEETAHDLLARLAIVPMVLEARGLDVTPAMIAKLTNAGDHDSATVLEIIAHEEIGHVAIGKRWFLWLCETRGVADPKAAWQSLVRLHFRGLVKPPFNESARTEAGLPPDYYEPLSERCLNG
ncbi:ferritin-like domain-containing protein [Limibacillus sp. MBR-115]|uniref:ferritin-like domain-containing protein n=1 Tax=Limibacillus sp. MBR-115 TaxID=3156465 RepID=UPI0033916CA9